MSDAADTVARRLAIQTQVLSEIASERDRQDNLWDPDRQHASVWPVPPALAWISEAVRRVLPVETAAGGPVLGPFGVPSEGFTRAVLQNVARVSPGDVTWALIALEEFAEVLEAPDEASRRAELIQLGALCVAWVEAMDRGLVPSCPEDES